jgi:hypothetical protein
VIAGGGLLAEFPSAEALVEGAAALQALGYRALEWYAPFPVSGLDDRLRPARSRLPMFVFGGGLVGAVLGYAIQWYADVRAYPMNVGGRPLHAVPTFLPATFEAAVLGAALVAFVGLWVGLRLPAPWHPVFEVEGFERASVDRFWLAVGVADPLYDRDRTGEALRALGPVRIVPLPEAPA